MLQLMSAEEANYCAFTVLQLRMEIHQYNTDLQRIQRRLNDDLNPLSSKDQEVFVGVKVRVEQRRNFTAKLVKDIREVLVNPPSLESRIIGFVYRVLSFRVI